MSRRCDVTGKGVQTGNNVSHAKNRTRRRFLPNLQKASFLIETLGRTVQMRLTARGIRTIEFKGGIDAFMAMTPARKLTGDALILKKQIAKCAAKAEAAAPAA
jgi:large subunit ribosomal protein L28